MGCGGGGGVSIHKCPGFIPQTDHRVSRQRPLEPPPPGSGPTCEAGRGRPGRGLGLCSSSSRMTSCLPDTRLADGTAKGFREPSGVGTITANRASNKARRAASWQKRSKTNSIMSLRDSTLEKQSRAPGRHPGVFRSPDTAFCLSSFTPGPKQLGAVSFK